MVASFQKYPKRRAAITCKRDSRSAQSARLRSSWGSSMSITEGEEGVYGRLARFVQTNKPNFGEIKILNAQK